jgi:hypothetical protein
MKNLTFNFNCLGCYITYNYDEKFNKIADRFQNILNYLNNINNKD